jgi:hypothetical protein
MPKSLRARPFAPDHTLAVSLAVIVVAGACGPKRLAVVGPLDDPDATAAALRARTRIEEPVRIDFRWRLNEAGSRVSGVGVARIEPPHRARLDLFLDNDESVMSAALVDDDLRLPRGAPDDILPPVELMWATLGVFRPMDGARLIGGERLEGSPERLRYAYDDRIELHFEIDEGAVEALELVEGADVVQWVRLERDGGRYPLSARYRNLVDFRELEITRTSVSPADAFDPAIFDPRR